MGIIWDRLGLAELSPEDRAKAGEAKALSLKMSGQEAFGIWKELEKSHPDNLAVKFGLVQSGYAEFIRPFHAPGLLEELVAEPRDYLLEKAENDPANPPLSLAAAHIYKDMWWWQSVAEYNEASQRFLNASPEDMPKTEALLARLLSAFEAAFAATIRDADYVPAMKSLTLATLKSIGDLSKTLSTPKAVAMLEDMAEKLEKAQADEKPSQNLGQRFTDLLTQAEAYAAAAGKAEGEERAGALRRKALGCYRQIVKLENVPEEEFHGHYYNRHAYSLLDAAYLMLTVADDENAAPAEKQALVEESVAVAERFRSILPDEPDSFEGGYGVAWNYCYAAKVVTDRESKLRYLQEAANRMEFNAKAFNGNDGSFWTSSLEDVNEEIEAVRDGMEPTPEEAAAFKSYAAHYYNDRKVMGSFDEVVLALYEVIARIRENLPVSGPFKILRAGMRYPDSPPYEPPKYLPEDYNAYAEVLHNLKEEDFLLLSLASYGKKKIHIIKIEFSFSKDNFSFGLRILETTDAFLADNFAGLMCIHGEAFTRFKALYATEQFQRGFLALKKAELWYGWAITVRDGDLRNTGDFYADAVAPGILRVSSVPWGEVFDVENPVHREKGLALEEAVLADQKFVRKVGYIFGALPEARR